MGCANTKELRCQHCNRPYSPQRRSYPGLPGIRRFHNRKHFRSRSHRSDYDSHRSDYDSHEHVASEISLYQSSPDNSRRHDTNTKNKPRRSITNEGNESPAEVIEGKKSKSPTGTMTTEPETINTWELMEGLEDTPGYQQPNVIDRCFSFHMESDSTTPSLHPSNSQTSLQGGSLTASPMKPVWLQMAGNDKNLSSKSIISDFDPEIISTFRKALDELSPKNALNLKSPDRDIFPSPGHSRMVSSNSMTFLKADNKVVIYFTTLRGVRKTFEDCCFVRIIFKETGAKLDERDVSMHYEFREDLKESLEGSGFDCRLPKVFVNGRCIGGAEEVQRLHEDDELEKVLKGCEMEEGGSQVCSVCGDVRFVPCGKCSGSCKVFNEDDEDGGAFYRCSNCNENGIIRCPACCG